MPSDRAVRRLTVLQASADKEPVPQRKFFHIGLPEVMDDVGECLPIISWVDDNLSRFVLSDAPSSTWGRGAQPPRLLVALPNQAVKPGDGVFLITGPGTDHKLAHPSGRGEMHFIHLGRSSPLFDRGVVQLFLYRLDGVQTKAVAVKKT